MASDPQLTFASCLNLYIYFNERGRAEEAERYRTRAEQHLASLQNAS